MDADMSDQLDLTQASPARIYNDFLGGKSAFEIDRQAAQAVVRTAPDARRVAIENFLFAGRTGRWAAERLRALDPHHPAQLLDIGCGIVDDLPPDMPRVEDQVHAVDADAVVVGVDNDPVVLAHARGLRQPGYGGVLPGDATDLDAIFNSPALRDVVDVERPMAVILAAVLHFVAEPDRVINDLRNWLAPGSILAISHATTTKTAAARVNSMTRAYENATDRIFFRPEEEIRSLVDGWSLIEPPGLVDVADWGRPAGHDGHRGEKVRVVGLVAELPSSTPALFASS
ncbi:SAM-dependent methyltransferase [Actinomadura violacea]|uniref:SAM-dependent methyltransferase n=1 Tax=Actinomadura violacea TaxID=2819934 RepID=A0ABS3S4S9_9ACTN|nr:SAM-dependent methyltransferase [Actinomadura violacea]MBO2464006.1 SAM-dependent methyltransferase [Actinomadura violacea]